MTVIFSKKCELGIQAVLFLSILEEGKRATSSQVAEALKVPKEFVSKVMQKLTETGIIDSRKGKFGGFALGKEPSEISLLDIVLALDGHEIFDSCVLGFPGCSVATPCPMHEEWGKIRLTAKKLLSTETLADLREKSINKISSL
ncbi:MAG: Rrf2 family transcriptional regulator [Ignavibacteriales bacterium]|nr:MAG: Rrf2 family transcriptional regulator [Ignavibacteriaceae bacterium]MBW7871925.1 Rrf2 family transcriptional regulator [Ignavibacteria bacterium]MCZ2144224.1 Rrf2 family transcriptional regulator [Ignavibacteriales bacterium]OQY78849.1 MAG: transcriptional regulator [Ignavibacteriales bacterium UTCHB3]MBV6446178.1 putative HTH-type transcriptional regulator [Ignavibacteriaceae bacterium]